MRVVVLIYAITVALASLGRFWNGQAKNTRSPYLGPDVAPKRSRRWLDGAVASVIIAAIVSALVGPYLMQTLSDKREERRETALTKGAARMLMADFATAIPKLDVIGHDRRLDGITIDFRPDLQPGDLKRIASALSIEEWGQVQTAMANLAGAEDYLRSLKARGKHRLTEEETCPLHADAQSLIYAIDALVELADAHRPDALPVPVDCGARTPN